MDIVERLRKINVGTELNSVVNDRITANEAANEIERLRQALKKTVEVCDVVLNKEFNWAVKMTLMKENVALARATLKEGE